VATSALMFALIEYAPVVALIEELGADEKPVLLTYEKATVGVASSVEPRKTWKVPAAPV
jgi:hypothetical protein